MLLLQSKFLSDSFLSIKINGSILNNLRTQYIIEYLENCLSDFLNKW